MTGPPSYKPAWPADDTMRACWASPDTGSSPHSAKVSVCAELGCLCCSLQVLNGAIAAALFNLLYDLVLSQKVKWYAMCPVVDFMNHNSSIQVSPFRV